VRPAAGRSALGLAGDGELRRLLRPRRRPADGAELVDVTTRRKHEREGDRRAARRLAEMEKEHQKERTMATTDANPPQRAVDEAIRRAASAAAGRQVEAREVSYAQRGKSVAIRVAGTTPDPLVYADVNDLLSIARAIAADWN
jgi:hypothetical protein